MTFVSRDRNDKKLDLKHKCVMYLCASLLTAGLRGVLLLLTGPSLALYVSIFLEKLFGRFLSLSSTHAVASSSCTKNMVLSLGKNMGDQSLIQQHDSIYRGCAFCLSFVWYNITTFKLF